MDFKKVLIISVILSMVQLAGATTINVDGNIDDWGLQNLTIGNWSDSSTWIPAIDGISFVVEDNQDPLNTMAINYNASYTGVHIIGNKTYQDIYREPLLVGPQTEPYGGPQGKYGEEYDIEAMYVDENDTHIFIAIVISTPDWVIPDIALNLDANNITGGYGFKNKYFGRDREK